MRDRRFACWRSKRRARAAVSVAPFRETPGTSAHACAIPEQEAVERVRVAAPSRLRRAVGQSHGDRPEHQAGGGCERRAERLDPALKREARSGRRRERERHHARAAGVERAKLVGDLAPERDEERQRGPAVKGNLEALARLGVELLPLPSGEEGNERDVSGARNRQELGRPLDQAEQGGALVGDAKGGAVAAHAAVSAGAGGGPPRRRLIRK